MKKIVSLVVLVAVICFSIGAFAEGVDFTSMTDDELLVLRDSIDKELVDRGAGFTVKDRIGAGEYIVGTDIKAGTYDFIISESEADEGGIHNTVGVYTTEDDQWVWVEYASEVGSHFTISLTEGTALTISDCSGFITAVEASWTP